MVSVCGEEDGTLILLTKNDERILVSDENVVLATNAADTLDGEQDKQEHTG